MPLDNLVVRNAEVEHMVAVLLTPAIAFHFRSSKTKNKNKFKNHHVEHI